jgi:hypothetical protein
VWACCALLVRVLVVRKKGRPKRAATGRRSVQGLRASLRVFLHMTSAPPAARGGACVTLQRRVRAPRCGRMRTLRGCAPPALLQTTTPHLQDAAAQGLASTALRRRIELASRSQAPSASSARLPVSSVRGPWPAWRVPAFCSSTTTAHHRRRRRTSWACTRACVRQATRCASSCPAVVRTALARRKAREASSRSRSPPEKSWGGMAGSLAPIGVW